MIIESLQSLAVPIESLQGLAGNPRVGDVAAVVASLERFGQRKPIVVRKDDGTIIAGNHTWQAAKQLGWTEIAVAFVSDDDATAQAFALADNRTAELGSYDDVALKERIEKVAAVDPDLVTASGWSEGAVQELLDKIEATQPKELKEDVIPEVSATTESKLGDMWQLGNHRLLCGDSTLLASYKQLMPSEKATMMFTDPPWNVAIGKDSNPRHRQREGLENDDLSSADFTDFLHGFASNAIQFVEGDVYCVLGASEWPTLDLNMRNVGFHWSATIIWVKDLFVLGRAKYHRRYEPIWYGWNAKGKSSFQNRRDLDDVWEIDRPRRSDEHPTMKPIELMVQAVENSSALRDIVLDPFGGSGSTLIACEQTNRAARLIELEPKYCDVIIKRWETLTGKSAVKLNA